MYNTYEHINEKYIPIEYNSKALLSINNECINTSRVTVLIRSLFVSIKSVFIRIQSQLLQFPRLAQLNINYNN